MKKLLLLLTFTLLFSACSTAVEELPEDDILDTEETVSESIEGLEIGDLLAGLTVTDIEYYRDGEGPTTAYNSTVSFEGSVTLSGDFIYYGGDAAFLSGAIIIRDLEYGDDFPYVDSRSNYIGLSNSDEAAELMGVEPADEGTVTFTIDAYQWVGLESEVHNLGNITEVVSIEID